MSSQNAPDSERLRAASAEELAASSKKMPFIWANYNISLTWIVGPFGDDFPYKNHDFQWGRTVRSWWNLPRFIYGMWVISPFLSSQNLGRIPCCQDVKWCEHPCSTQSHSLGFLLRMSFQTVSDQTLHFLHHHIHTLHVPSPCLHCFAMVPFAHGEMDLAALILPHMAAMWSNTFFWILGLRPIPIKLIK